MPRVNQTQINSKVGMTFAAGLRALLRQDPDIIMVGEIRDSETLEIAMHAAMTGHLVLSTLHTNSAAATLPRMLDMGAEPFLIASSVILVAAQRLCRKVCPHCREKIEIPKQVFERLGIDIQKFAPEIKEKVFYKGRGCDKCSKTGYLGRMGILETLVIDDPIRDLVMKRASSYEIKEYATKKGMSTLREDALKKVCLGMTTLDEILRVTSEE
jgi:type II secretory ATPase GspE/PulE/Tfp pilus assembly ATPase PilB-like protein